MRRRDDSGVALVEFAFVSLLLIVLVLGIVHYGLILSFKQDMTRAAAESARAGAVALPTGSQTHADAAEAAALSAAKEVVSDFSGPFATNNPDEPGKGCQHVGMSCGTPTVAPCVAEPALECIVVELEYDYGSHPLYGRVPIISAFLPDRISATSVARINK